MSNLTLDEKAPDTTAEAAPPPEKRRHPRHELAVRCWITDERHTVYLRVHDISRGGLSVRASVPFAPSGAIDVGLELPGGRRVRARGEVVWVRTVGPADRGARMGARFVEFVEGEDELARLLATP